MKESVRIIAVVGPTASGKTEIGIKLAQETGGEIISVDSMQIYRFMNIGTAKPTPDMLTRVPHHLIDILNPDQEYNAGKFAEDADKIIQNLKHNNKPAILVGGTGLYLRALIHGMIEVPEISDSVRKEVRDLAAHNGVLSCYRHLLKLDPKSAEKLHPNDITRITRALEVRIETGKSILEFQVQHGFQQERYQALTIGASWNRNELYERINKRVHLMVDEGLIDEVKTLLAMGYDESLPSMNSIGYKQAVSYIQGEIGLGDMIADIQQKSRRYAKKQLTWYRNDLSIHWLENNILTDDLIEKSKEFLATSP